MIRYILVIILAAFAYGYTVHLNSGMDSQVHELKQISPTLDCLARNVYLEARGEPVEGMRAVAEVTVNRAAYRRKSVCEVVYERNAFSWTRADHRKYREKLQSDLKAGSAYLHYKRAYKVASEVYYMKTDSVLPAMAMNYHRTDVQPVWRHKLKVERVIGSHVFYSGV